MTAAREGYHRTGMSIFLLFLRRLWIALDANSHTVLKQCVASNRYARKICENFSKCLCGGIPPGQARSCGKLLCFRKRYSVYAYLATHFFLSGTPINKRHCQQSRTTNLHRSITFHKISCNLNHLLLTNAQISNQSMHRNGMFQLFKNPLRTFSVIFVIHFYAVFLLTCHKNILIYRKIREKI